MPKKNHIFLFLSNYDGKMKINNQSNVYADAGVFLKRSCVVAFAIVAPFLVSPFPIPFFMPTCILKRPFIDIDAMLLLD